MASRPALAPIVDPHARRRDRARERIAVAAGVLVGAAAVVGLGHALVLLHAPPSPPPPPPAAPPVAITVPPPLVVTIEKPVAAPDPVDDLGCTAPATAETAPAIGRAVDPDTIAEGPATDTPPRVFAAAAAPQLAVLENGAVWVSDDLGRTFSRLLPGEVFDHVTVARDGVIYAETADRIAVRTPDRRTAWRSLDFLRCQDPGPCARRIATNGTELVGLVNDTVATSTDRGKSWTVIVDPDAAWSDHHGEAFSWRGALYQVTHYEDMCGVDDNHVFRIDAQHRIVHDIFHNNAMSEAPVLHPTSDVGTSWAWTERCWTERNTLERCAKPVGARRDLLQASSLIPREGGRTLAVWRGSLVELCARGARQVYRAFPLPGIDAVDTTGRALAFKDTTLLGWSAVHGWRALRTFTPPAPTAAAAP